MYLNLVDIFLLLAASHGLLLAFLNFHKRHRPFANRLLGALMLFYAIVILNMIINDLYRDRLPHLTLLLAGLNLLTGPLHYLYAKYLTQSSLSFKRHDWLHFIPLVVYLVSLIPDLNKTGAAVITGLNRITITGLPLRFLVFNFFVIAIVLFYFSRTLLLLNQYSHSIKTVFSSIESIRLHWLRNMTLLGIIGWLVFLGENLLLIGGINLSNYFSLSSILAALFFYTLGYLGLFKSGIFAEPEIARTITEMPTLLIPSEVHESSANPETHAKYAKSGLMLEKAEAYRNLLLELMTTERPYIDSELTLQKLAERMKISAHNLSEVINSQLGQNFFDFINKYRVEQVEKDFADPQKQHLKILSIALDAGFNSKTSFNTIFKKYTQLTPSEYRKRIPASPAESESSS